MQGYGHNVWDVTYGMLFGQNPNILAREFVIKTVQYEWLLAQSLDGSMFVDPRPDEPDATDPAPTDPAAGGSTSMDPTLAAGGETAAAGTGATPEPVPTPMVEMGTAGTGQAPGNSTGGAAANDGGCSLFAETAGKPGSFGWAVLLGSLAYARRRRACQSR
jgi:hypothetical protein